MRRRRSLGSLALTVALFATVALVAGCGSDAAETGADGAPTPWPGEHDDIPAGVAVDEEMTGPNVEVLGQGSLEGQDVVVWFWAEW